MSDCAANTCLFSFTPLDTFSFSGENSARTKGITDTFLSQAHNATRRQSFRVETDEMPPQTTMMGAIRRIFYGTDIGIGAKSFNIANDSYQDMGDILSLSAVFLKGKNDKGEEVYCLPAPFGIMKCENAVEGQSSFIPMQPDLFDPKSEKLKGFFVFKKDNLEEAPEWHAVDEFVMCFEQPVVHIGDNCKADGYHLQCKCCFKTDTFSDLSFCVMVTLKKQPKQTIHPMLISLGSRDGRFMAETEKTSFSPEAFSDKLIWKGDQDFWCASLLSASLLPENWREFEGLKQAFVETRNMRCALSNANFSLQLISEKMVFADVGSVFLFDSESHRNSFVNAIQANERRICGLNQVLSYQIVQK